MTPADPPADPPVDPPAPGPDPDDAVDREPTDDELAVHAVLDGEATATQRRRVAGDPSLRARVTEMKAVVDQVAAPPQAPGDDVFEAIRAAAATHLGDAEEIVDLRDDVPDDHAPAVEPGAAPSDPPPDASDDPPEADDVVVALDRPRRQRRGGWPALPAVAAAVLVLIALGVGLIVTAGDEGSSDFTAVGSSVGDDGGEGAGGATEESSDAQSRQEGQGETATDAPVTTTGPAASGDDGDGASDDLAPQASFPDDAALREVLQEVDPATLVLDPGPEGFESDRLAGNLQRAEDDDVARCSSVLQSSDPGIGPAQAAVVVDVAGETVYVLSSPLAADDAGAATTLLHALDPVSCVPRFAVQR